MATEAQIMANRAKARKSTGSRTPEGRAAVAQNPVTHGLMARATVLPGTRGYLRQLRGRTEWMAQ